MKSITARSKRTAPRESLSLPENLVHRIDAVAKAQRLARSAFLAKAAEREMAEA
ncbi:type II toxin-antitoxin system HicB family antitoxin [Castellaniella caeni]|uniref:type II toxin-antitoxin system HicB family antitoxin n=1 Tax=Castellaniella caeni TaxID=266123 RepID=UPI001E2AF726|nr:type II toxin-antitoxin system HicB family antitoxin [Castellaniella caeni]